MVKQQLKKSKSATKQSTSKKVKKAPKKYRSVPEGFTPIVKDLGMYSRCVSVDIGRVVGLEEGEFINEVHNECNNRYMVVIVKDE